MDWGPEPAFLNLSASWPWMLVTRCSMFLLTSIPCCDELYPLKSWAKINLCPLYCFCQLFFPIAIRNVTRTENWCRAIAATNMTLWVMDLRKCFVGEICKCARDILETSECSNQRLICFSCRCLEKQNRNRNMHSADTVHKVQKWTWITFWQRTAFCPCLENLIGA